MSKYEGDINIRVNADLNTSNIEKALKELNPQIEIEPNVNLKSDKFIKQLKTELEKSLKDLAAFQAQYDKFYKGITNGSNISKLTDSPSAKKLNQYTLWGNNFQKAAQEVVKGRAKINSVLSTLGVSADRLGFSDEQKAIIDRANKIEDSYKSATSIAIKSRQKALKQYSKAHNGESIEKEITPFALNFGDAKKLDASRLQSSILTIFKNINKAGTDVTKMTNEELDLQIKRLEKVIPLMEELYKLDRSSMVKFGFNGDEKSTVGIGQIKSMLKDYKYTYKQNKAIPSQIAKEIIPNKTQEKDSDKDVYIDQLEENRKELELQNKDAINKLAETSAKNSKLESEKADLLSKNKDLAAKNEKLTTENQEFKKDSKLKSSQDSAKQDMTSSELKVKQKSDARFKSEIQLLRRRIEKMEAENKQLSSENNQLNKDIEIFREAANATSAEPETNQAVKASGSVAKKSSISKKKDASNTDISNGAIPQEPLRQLKKEIEDVFSSVTISKFNYDDALEKLRSDLNEIKISVKIDRFDYDSALKTLKSEFSNEQIKVDVKESNENSDNNSLNNDSDKPKKKSNKNILSSKLSSDINSVGGELDNIYRKATTTANSAQKKSGYKNTQSFIDIKNSASQLTSELDAINNALSNISKDAGNSAYEDIAVKLDKISESSGRLKQNLQSASEEFEQFKVSTSQQSSTDQLQKKIATLTSQYIDFKNANSKAFKKDPEIAKMWEANFAGLTTGKFGDTKDLSQFDIALKQMRSNIKAVGTEGKTAGELIQGMFKKYGGWAMVTRSMMYARTLMRQIFTATQEVDTAMVNLKKVTDASASSFEQFLGMATNRAKELGISISDLIDSTAEFSRLGYNLEDSSRLGELATMYSKVAEDLSATDAASSIISTMKAFKISAADAEEIVDKFNYVGNNFAISSTGLGDSLQRSASALVAANNSLDETIALTTAGNAIVQDPEKLGTILKTASARLRGAKAELEEMGEETDDVADGTSKLREEILALSGVDIMKDKDTFKGTYQILDEISRVYNDLSDVNQAALIEKIGGKNGINVISAILSNFGEARQVMSEIGNANGSASAEMERSLDSVTGKLGKLSAIFQEISQKVLESDTVKSFLDFLIGVGNTLSRIIPDLNTVLTLGGSIAAVSATFKKVGRNKMIFLIINMPTVYGF